MYWLASSTSNIYSIPQHDGTDDAIQYVAGGGIPADFTDSGTSETDFSSPNEYDSTVVSTPNEYDSTVVSTGIDKQSQGSSAHGFDWDPQLYAVEPESGGQVAGSPWQKLPESLKQSGNSYLSAHDTSDRRVMRVGVALSQKQVVAITAGVTFAVILACIAVGLSVYAIVIAKSGVSGNASPSAFADASTSLTAQIQQLNASLLQQLNTTQHQLEAECNNSISQLTYFQTGMIILWSGHLDSIPKGFALCNGSNNTPDLQRKFIMGAGSNSDVGMSGGASSITLTTNHLPSHNHGISAIFTGNSLPGHSHNVNDPGHSHSMVGSLGEHGYNSAPANYHCTGALWGSSTDCCSCYNMGATDRSGTGTNVAPSSGGIPSGTISASSSASGAGLPFQTVPPYYTLAYIMKL